MRARIGQLRERLASLNSINLTQLPRDQVGIGSKVTLLDLDSDAELTYELVFPEMADLQQGLLSLASPIGRGLLGRREGDTVTVAIPTGTRRFEVLELHTLHEED